MKNKFKSQLLRPFTRKESSLKNASRKLDTVLNDIIISIDDYKLKNNNAKIRSRRNINEWIVFLLIIC